MSKEQLHVPQIFFLSLGNLSFSNYYFREKYQNTSLNQFSKSLLTHKDNSLWILIAHDVRGTYKTLGASLLTSVVQYITNKTHDNQVLQGDGEARAHTHTLSISGKQRVQWFMQKKQRSKWKGEHCFHFLTVKKNPMKHQNQVLVCTWGLWLWTQRMRLRIKSLRSHWKLEYPLPCCQSFRNVFSKQ